MKPLMLVADIEKPKRLISYKDKIMLLGSCFSEHIGARMQSSKMRILQNPNGILFDPFSIIHAIESYLSMEAQADIQLYQHDSLWHSWAHHSSFSAADKNLIKKEIEYSTNQAHNFLKEARWLIITPGSAWYYSLKEHGKEVANCHKAPASLFNKNLADTEDLYKRFDSVIHHLKLFNPDLNIIFTVSPVRHIKDGIVENNISKARLIDVVHNLKNNHDHVFYFPSYELVIDVLRDYRFFNEDLVHPTAQAIDYVFENFMGTCLDDEGKEIFNEINKWKQSEAHRPLKPEGAAYKIFRQKHEEETERLKHKYPYLNF